MSNAWTLTLLGLLVLGPRFARGEDTVTADPVVAATPVPAGQVRIYSFNGREVPNHPNVIDVLPGEKISLKADVLQFGGYCLHADGCPQGRNAEEFVWSADDRADDQCTARYPDACRDRTAFQPEGNEMIFHIPYAMGREITLRVSHDTSGSQDTVILHNAHFQSLAREAGAYREDGPLYPKLGSPDEPCAPYYYCSPYAYWGPYPYYGWAWGWRYPGWTIGIGWGWGYGYGYGYGWGWGAPYGWYAGYYHPGFGFGYYHPGLWRPVAAGGYGPRFGNAAAMRPVQRMSPQYSPRAMGAEQRSQSGGGRSGGRRRRGGR